VRIWGPRRPIQMCRTAAALVAALLGILASQPARVHAEVASDHPAAILVFPKLLVDTPNGLDTLIRISNVSETPIKVKCFYVNTTPECSLADGSCFPNQRTCTAVVGSQTFFGTCTDQWQETDFIFKLTREQPTGWLVSGGERLDCRFIDGVCSNDGTTVCDRDTECGAGNRCVRPACLPLDGPPLGRVGRDGQINEGAVPISPADPFVGELKCIALDDSEVEVARNDLIGEVLIGRLKSGPDQAIELAGYNAIGIPAIPGTGNRDGTLVLGGPPEAAEYDGCPNVLILDHYFDGAIDPVLENSCLPSGTCSIDAAPCASNAECLANRCIGTLCSVTGTTCGGDMDCRNVCTNDLCTLSGERCVNSNDCSPSNFEVRLATSLTLVPCTEDFEEQKPEIARTTAQFLVYNEFEQRFSTSIPIQCFKEIQLSAIETSGDNSRSIFSAGVAGTLTGQTRIRGVENQLNSGRAGNTLLGVAEEFRCTGAPFQFPVCNFVEQPERMVSGNAKNLHFQGRRALSDFIYLP